MTTAHNAIVVTGPDFEQRYLDGLLVTPTGGIQMSLRNALAFGGNLSSPPPIGNVTPGTGAFSTLTMSGLSTFGGVGLGGLAIDAGSALTKTGWLQANSNGGSTTWTTGSGSAGKSLVFASGGQTGTIPASGSWGAFALGIPADTVGSGANASGFNGMTLSHNWGGAGMSGSRTTLLLQSVQTGVVGTANAFYDGINSWMVGNFAGNGGNMISMNPQVNLTSGATGWALAEIMEGQVQAIQPVLGRVGIQMFGGLGSQGSSYDFAYGVSGIPSGAGFLTAFQLGAPNAPWGLDPTNGAIMSANANNSMQLKHGINLPNVTFTSDSINLPGFVVDGSGNTTPASLALASRAAPSTPATGTFVLYVDTADNKLKAKGPGGTVTVLALP